MHKMKDRTSKNRQRGQRSTIAAGDSNTLPKQSKHKQNGSTGNRHQNNGNGINSQVATTAHASTKIESRNAIICDNGECFNGSKNGDIVTRPQIILDYSVTTPSSDETEKTIAMVDSNCNNISVDMTPNRDINADVVSTNIDKTTPTTHLDNQSEATTHDTNAQQNPPLVNTKFQSNFSNQIMEQMRAASVDVIEPSIPRLEKQTSLTYSDGQWSPNNADGKKFYHREQLIMLRDQPASQNQPQFSGRVAAIVKSNANQFNVPKGNHNNNLLPNFVPQNNYKQSAAAQRANFAKRPSMNSMQSAQNNVNNSKGSKSGIIHMSLSLHEDIKLNETENAWTPSFLKKDRKDAEPIADEQASNELLYKRVRGVLNKLTPERFDALLSEIQSFNIDTIERLQGVIVLVFEKAIDEPHFSVAYAQLCRKLSESMKSTEGEKTTFKKTLISKCQHEFEKHVVNEQAIAAKLAPFLAKVNETSDVEKKAEYQSNLEEEERKLRRRSVGTVRFIGELYKIGMLITRIMVSCIRLLIQDKDSEDKLECLCKLLTTIGATLEDYASCPENASTKTELNAHFKQMQLIVDKKIPNLKISSRVRFMLQDVIDLRESRWVPRRNDFNPKTMGQIQKEAEDEQKTIQLLNYNVQGRRDDRNRNDNRNNSGLFNHKPNRAGQVDENGWSMSGSKSRSQTYTVDPSKFRTKTSIDDSTVFGVASQFKWGQNPTNNNTMPAPPLANSFAALDSVRGMGNSNENLNRNNRRGRDNYHSKGSMERYQYGGQDRRNSRSGSQHGSRENSLARNFPTRNAQPFNRSSQSMHAMTSTQPITYLDRKPVPPVLTKVVEPDVHEVTKIQKLVRSLLECHHIGEVSLASCHIDIETILVENRWVAVREIFNAAAEVQRLVTADRTFAGKSINQWIKLNLITPNDVLNGLKSFLEVVEDISVDIPHIWIYIAEGIAPLIEDKYLKLTDLKLLCPEFVHRILEDLLPYLKSVYGSPFVKNIVKLNPLNDLVPSAEMITPKLKFLFTELSSNDNAKEVPHPASNPDTVQGKPTSNQNLEDIQRHIKNLLMNNTTLDEIYNYISANVAQIDDSFIKALTMAVVDSTLDNRHKLNDTIFLQRIPLLERYMDENEKFQLQCLLAIQMLIVQLEHPPGLIQNIFSMLYTERIVQLFWFKEWRNYNELMEGKGVAVASLHTFFETLDNDNEASSEEEDN